jgi:hypothetical protein
LLTILLFTNENVEKFDIIKCLGVNMKKIDHNLLVKLLIAVVIGLCGFIFRGYMAVNGPIEYDEPVYMRAAVNYSKDILSGNWKDLITSDYNIEHPPFYKIIYGAVLANSTQPQGYFPVPKSDRITGLKDFQSIFNLRIVSVVFGSLAVFLLSLVNPWAGVILAIHTYAVKYTSVIYLEALPLFLSILSVFSFSKFLKVSALGKYKIFKRGTAISRSKESTLFFDGITTTVQVTWLIISAASLGMAVASKYMYAVAGLAIGGYVLILAIKKKSYKPLIPFCIWSGMVILFFFMSDPVLWLDPIRHIKESIKFNINYSGGDEVEKYNYPIWQPILWLLKSIPATAYSLPPFFVAPGNYFFAIDALFFPLALIGIPKLKKDYPVYLNWLIIGVAFLLVWKTKWPQYILIILPPYCLSAALGGRTILSMIARELEAILHRVQPKFEAVHARKK